MSASPRVRGFALGDNASRYARKGHQLGPPYCHEWSPDQARAASQRAAALRSAQAQRRRDAQILRVRLVWRLCECERLT